MIIFSRKDRKERRVFISIPISRLRWRSRKLRYDKRAQRVYPPPPSLCSSSHLSQGDSLAGAVFRGGRKGGGARIGKSSEGRANRSTLAVTLTIMCIITYHYPIGSTPGTTGTCDVWQMLSRLITITSTTGATYCFFITIFYYWFLSWGRNAFSRFACLTDAARSVPTIC